MIVLIAAAATIALLFVGPIAQDPAYHQFADTREIAGIANFCNVVSNLPFLLAGLHGLSRTRHLAVEASRNGYLALCVGVLLVGVGSSYYHFAPSTQSLLWDRLPMTIAFMALFSLLLDERVMPGGRSSTLWPLLVAGLGSVLYWYWTESRGAGDLRPYALVQFLPIILIPAILLLFRRRYLNGQLLLAALALYFVAKLFEQFDQRLFDWTGVLAGHTVKHIVAGVAVLLIIQALPTVARK